MEIKLSEISLNESMMDIIRTHFNKNETSTVEEVLDCLDDYIFWESDESMKNLFNGVDKQTLVLVDIE